MYFEEHLENITFTPASTQELLFNNVLNISTEVPQNIVIENEMQQFNGNQGLQAVFPNETPVNLEVDSHEKQANYPEELVAIDATQSDWFQFLGKNSLLKKHLKILKEGMVTDELVRSNSQNDLKELLKELFQFSEKISLHLAQILKKHLSEFEKH